MILTGLGSPTASESACYEGWLADYHLGASKVYSRAFIDLGQPLPLEAHSCSGWAVGDEPGVKDRVAVRPLYNDTGLPLYEIFEQERYELVGYEFRILRFIEGFEMLDRQCISFITWQYDGFSIALSLEDEFFKMGIYTNLTF